MTADGTVSARDKTVLGKTIFSGAAEIICILSLTNNWEKRFVKNSVQLSFQLTEKAPTPALRFSDQLSHEMRGDKTRYSSGKKQPFF